MNQPSHSEALQRLDQRHDDLLLELENLAEELESTLEAVCPKRLTETQES